MLRKVKRLDEAVQSFTRALDMDPDGKQGAIWNNLGQAYMALERSLSPLPLPLPHSEVSNPPIRAVPHSFLCSFFSTVTVTFGL